MQSEPIDEKVVVAGCGAEIYEIGDGNRVGNVLTSIQDAFEITHNL